MATTPTVPLTWEVSDFGGIPTLEMRYDGIGGRWWVTIFDYEDEKRICIRSPYHWSDWKSAKSIGGAKRSVAVALYWHGAYKVRDLEMADY